MSPGLTPSQTVGPFFAIALPWPEGPHAVPPGSAGAIHLAGRLLDGAGDPVPDGMIESWQADPEGRFAHPDDPRGAAGSFRGFARCATDAHGHWELVTLKPGRVPGPDGALQAPHVDLSVFARGLLDRVVTRICFADEPEANAADPVLAALPDDAARATLLATPVDGGYELDIHLQGPHETVFFSV
jgi:protocatechuate 3,4-dioxygenase alpha subunit